MMYKSILCTLFFTSTWSKLISATSLDVKSNSACGEVGDCMLIETECTEKCGCDKTIPTIFDNTTQECLIDMKLLISSLTEKYNTEDYENESMGYDMAKHIRAEADRIFQGVIFAALFFITCASVCVLMACLYCCRMNYSDNQLKKSIKVLAKKVGTTPQRRPTVKAPTPTKPISESCNVIVEEAGVFCV